MIDCMVVDGYIIYEVGEEVKVKLIIVKLCDYGFKLFVVEYFIEEVCCEVVDIFGIKCFYEGGFLVCLIFDLEL